MDGAPAANAGIRTAESPAPRLGFLNGGETMPNRSWRIKFSEAFAGVAQAIREQTSFRVHLVVASLVLILAALLRCSPGEWCLLIACIVGVFAAETFNSALETLFHALDDATKNRMSGCLDQAAGAVLLVSLGAVAIGAIIFLPKLLAFLARIDGGA